ncbi:MAG TPA: succinylglutamate desuccinylase/aspartoacylase family protein [Candidatus Paceibacterota bacterium]|nr:succinylglutamate desuccinylase/aspartoacylase family protein [Candidatus Paceibacterota bacterium]
MQDLERIVEELAAKTHEGVAGVVHLDSGVPGPTVGITVATHGNEPAGLAAAQFLLAPETKLLKGSVYLVLNNIEAARAYLKATTDEEKRRARFIDINLNRLPQSLFEREGETRYEMLRAQELLLIWSRFEIALDIHSTSQDSDPMLIGLGERLPAELIDGFPIQKVITGIDTVMRDRSAADFYGTSERPCRSFGIECGGHEHSESYDRAVVCVRSLLQNLQMLAGTPESTTISHDEYAVFTSIYFPNESYELTKVFENFEPIKAGTILARGNGADILAPEDGHVLFAPKTTKPTHLTEEVLFLTKPVRPYKSV